MNRREFLLKSALMGAATSLPLSSWKSFFKENPFTEIRRNVGTFTGRGGTIGWLMNKDAVVVVDSQYPQSADQCRKGIQERTDLPVDMLINTHHHGDHTAGNPVFEAAQVVGHKNVPDLMRKAVADRGQEAMDKLVVPTTTYSDRWVEEAGDERIMLIHHGPAHTSGDSIVFFEKAQVAHMGDLVFNRVYPFIDRNSGASIKNWVKTLILAREDLPRDTIYIFGHGNAEYGITGDRMDLQKQADYLMAVVDYTQKGIDSGKPKEEIMKATELKGFEEYNAEGWRLPLSANIDVAYEEIMEARR